MKKLEAATIGSGAEALLKPFRRKWEHKVTPTEWKHSARIPIHVNKDKLDCSNYRGISLLYRSSKIFSSIILQRINGRRDEILA